MKITDEELLAKLQQEFLSDASSSLEQLLENMSLFRSNPEEGLSGLWKVIHTVKGNAQAIGFGHFANFLIAFEDALTNVEAAIRKLKVLPDQAMFRLDRNFANFATSMEEYFVALKEKGGDAEALLQSREPITRALREWQPEVDGGDWGMSLPHPSSGQVVQENVVKKEMNSVATTTAAAVKKNSEPTQVLEEEDAVPTKRRLLLVSCNTRHFAIDMSNVVEIIEQRGWSQLPIARPGFLGVMNRFGDVLPVIDFSVRIGIRAPKAEPERQQSTAENSDGKSSGKKQSQNRRSIVVCSAAQKRFGFPVDSVSQIVEIPTNELQPASTLELRRHRGVVTHMTVLNHEAVLLVDLEKLIL